MNSLNDELEGVIGNKRRFLLLRITDVDTQEAMKLCGVNKTTYDSWCKDKRFVTVYRRREEFSSSSKTEAYKLLRRSNQLQAILLEEKIIKKLAEEIDSGELNLCKSFLGRDVYSKLVSELDHQPQIASLTWNQRILSLQGEEPKALPDNVIEGEIVGQG